MSESMTDSVAPVNEQEPQKTQEPQKAQGQNTGNTMSRRKLFGLAGAGIGLLGLGAMGGYTTSRWRNDQPLLPDFVRSADLNLTKGTTTHLQYEVRNLNQLYDFPNGEYKVLGEGEGVRAFAPQVWFTDFKVTNTGDNMQARMTGTYTLADNGLETFKSAIPYTGRGFYDVDGGEPKSPEESSSNWIVGVVDKVDHTGDNAEKIINKILKSDYGEKYSGKVYNSGPLTRENEEVPTDSPIELNVAQFDVPKGDTELTLVVFGSNAVKTKLMKTRDDWRGQYDDDKYVLGSGYGKDNQTFDVGSVNFELNQYRGGK